MSGKESKKKKQRLDFGHYMFNEDGQKYVRKQRDKQ